MWYYSRDGWPLVSRDGAVASPRRPAVASAEVRRALLISVSVLGILAALDPLRPVVFALVLGTRRVNAVALLAGWALALSVLFCLVLVVFGGDLSEPSSARQRTWASAAEIVLGAVLLAVAAHRWRRRHGTGRHLVPAAVLQRLDRLDPVRAGVVGVLMQPRTLTVAAALVVARERSGVVGLVVGFSVFAVVSTSILLGILGYDLWRPETAQRGLTGLTARLEQQGPRLVMVLCAVGGSYLVLDGLRGLVRG